MAKRAWTPEQRRVQSERLRVYYQTHAHPRKNRAHSVVSREKMKKPKVRGEILGHCLYCKRPLYSPVSALRGYGPECAGLTPGQQQVA